MQTPIEFDYKKATQAVNLFASREPAKKIIKMKVIKLIWLADRFHLRNYGRPITGDQYWAMPFGPVGSSVKDIAEGSSFLSEAEKEYSDRYLRINGNFVQSVREPDLDVFSDSDIQALRFAYDRFGRFDARRLVDLSHIYPEWRKFKNQLESEEATRERMSYIDFFLDPDPKSDDIAFTEDRQTVENAKLIFQEDWQLAAKWS